MKLLSVPRVDAVKVMRTQVRRGTGIAQRMDMSTRELHKKRLLKSKVCPLAHGGPAGSLSRRASAGRRNQRLLAGCAEQGQQGSSQKPVVRAA